MANALFHDAIDANELPRNSQLLAYLSLINSLRLSLKFDEAHAAVEKCKSMDLTEYETNELRWEEICLMRDNYQKIVEMLNLVKRNASHERCIYILETYLWTKSFHEDLSERMPMTMKYLTRRKDLNLKIQKQFYQFCLVIERLTDYDIPFAFRIEEIGKKLSETNQLISIDKELLFLVGTLRWLVKSRSYYLAHIVNSKYELLSLQLSSFQSKDVLGLCEDLKDKDWYRNPSLHVAV